MQAANNDNAEQVIRTLIRWSETQDPVRALILYSSRTNPFAVVDRFSDFDVLLALTDIDPYWQDRRWLGDFGRVLVAYRNPVLLHERYGISYSAHIVQYEDGTKIDFALFPVGLLRAMVADPVLPSELDTGFRILLDKDGLAEGIRPPTFRAHIPTPPSEQAYLELIEEFFLDCTYVAKHLWRGDLVPAKSMLEHNLKQDYLRRMLEWWIEIDHGWSIKPGAHGRELKRWIGHERWAELEATYAGSGYDENFAALFRTIDLFRKTAAEVGRFLGFPYPYELDRRVIEYLIRIDGLSR